MVNVRKMEKKVGGENKVEKDRQEKITSIDNKIENLQKIAEKNEEKMKCKFNLEKEFLRSTSMHGYGFIFRTENKFRKFFWFSVSLAGFMLMLFYVQDYFVEYLTKRPTSIAINLQFHEKMELPTISFCPPIGHRKSLLVKDDNYRFLLSFQRNYLELYMSSNLETYKNNSMFLKQVYDDERSHYNNDSNNILFIGLTTQQRLDVAYMQTSIYECVGDVFEHEYALHLVATRYVMLTNSSRDSDEHAKSIITEDYYFECIEEKIKYKWPVKGDLDSVILNVGQVDIMEFISKYLNKKNISAHFFEIKDVPKMIEIQTEILATMNYDALIYIADNIVDDYYLRTNHQQDTRKFSWKLKDNLVSCSFGNNSCSSKDFEEAVDQTGVCYVYKGDRYQSSNGESGGLSITLNMANYDGYAINSYESITSGLKLIASDDDEPFAQQFRHMVLDIGRSSSVVMKKRNLSFLDTYFGGNCNESAKITTYDKFTTYGCVMNCVFLTVEKLCNCLNVDDPRMKTEEDYERHSCRTFQQIFCSSIAKQSAFNRTIDECNLCFHPPCKSNSFSSKIRSFPINNETFLSYIFEQEIECLTKYNENISIPADILLWKPPLHLLSKYTTKCLTRFNWQENILAFSLFYEDLSEIYLQERPKYKLNDFVGYILYSNY
ncbi:hypothetical protein SNEBB_006926 [Seison nebaliae]|nr:hypothetical protein SNEBB_006926 [Seison nebaliae]